MMKARGDHSIISYSTANWGQIASLPVNQYTKVTGLAFSDDGRRRHSWGGRRDVWQSPRGHGSIVTRTGDGKPIGSPNLEPTAVRQTHYFSAWLDYNFNAWLTGEVGYWNSTSALDGAGQRANIVFNRLGGENLLAYNGPNIVDAQVDQQPNQGICQSPSAAPQSCFRPTVFGFPDNFASPANFDRPEYKAVPQHRSTNACWAREPRCFRR